MLMRVLFACGRICTHCQSVAINTLIQCNTNVDSCMIRQISVHMTCSLSNNLHQLYSYVA